MTIDPDRACPHEEFDALVGVVPLVETEDGPVTGYTTEIRVWCKACSEPFRWIGVQAGASGARPMCSIDETELRAPIRPASSDPDFGMGIPGFSVSYRERRVDRQQPSVDTTQPDDHGIIRRLP